MVGNLPNRTIVEVAVGVLLKNNEAVLLAQRPDGKPYAGYWEFPGGKIEADETLFEALKRELLEEINIQILDAKEFLIIEHDYPHAYVRLHVCLVNSWDGEIKGLENQATAWLSLSEISKFEDSSLKPILPATLPIFEKLKSIL